jgi:hypothetical protein
LTSYKEIYSKAIPQTKTTEELEKASYTPLQFSDIPNGFGIGSSFAYSMNYSNNKRGFSANTDFSYTIYVVTPSLNLKYLNLKNKSFYGFQFELCIYIPYIANLGGGVGYLWGYKNAPIYHIFIGIPIPLILSDKNYDPIYKINFKPFNVIAIEPFMRINFFKKDKYFEFGIMLKFNTMNVAKILGV